MKKVQARETKVRKLKDHKAQLQNMCEEAVKLVELWTAFSAMQSRQIEKLVGRNIFGRIISVFFTGKSKQPELQAMSEEFMKKFKTQQEELSGDNTSKIDS